MTKIRVASYAGFSLDVHILYCKYWKIVIYANTFNVCATCKRVIMEQLGGIGHCMYLSCLYLNYNLTQNLGTLQSSKFN